MPLRAQDIESCESDDALFHKLSAELQRRVRRDLAGNYDLLVPTIRRLPRGLRAMAATYHLDVSMALDDLGWHFYNLHHREFCFETQWGLRELEAREPAEIFNSAYALVEPHWDEFDRGRMDAEAFGNWYENSGLEKELHGLNDRLWAICSEFPNFGLMQFWLTYARKYPERLADKPPQTRADVGVDSARE
jgi:hypothetical protein